ncbi:MAG: type II secretion system F family protein [Fervidicoccaceae archaeon]
MRFTDLAKLVEGTPLDRLIVSRFSWLERYVIEAGFPLPSEYYARASLGASLLALAASFIALLPFHMLVLGYDLLASILLAALLSFIASLFVLATLLYAPVIKFKRSMSSMNKYAPFTLVVLATAAAAGLSVREALLMASRFVLCRATRRSLSRILFDVMSGAEVADALYRESTIVASPVLSGLYEGLASIARTGVGLFEYLDNSMRAVLDELEAKLRKTVDSLAVLSEMFVVGALVLPLTVEVAVLFLGGLVGMPISPILLFVIVDFIVVPTMFVILLILADSALSEVSA